MNGHRNIAVYAVEGSRANTAVEMCEHKGLGHPDTVTDTVCEAVVQELACTYERNFGSGRHFNVDKGLLVGGRATDPEHRLDLSQLVVSTASRWLDANLQAGSSFFQFPPRTENLRASS